MSKFRAKTCHGECGDPECSGSHVGIAPASPYKPGVDWTLREGLTVEQVLDMKTLHDLEETADCMTEEEQASFFERLDQTDELA